MEDHHSGQCISLQHGRCLNDCERKPQSRLSEVGVAGSLFQTKRLWEQIQAQQTCLLKQPLCHACSFGEQTVQNPHFPLPFPDEKDHQQATNFMCSLGPLAKTPDWADHRTTDHAQKGHSH